jgi:adenylosuccinate lyase
MDFPALLAISPVDGRYRRITAPLSDYFSEASVIKYRAFVEIEYFIALCRLPLPQLTEFPSPVFASLRELISNFSIADAEAVKSIEKETNHDVKAVEIWLRKKFDNMGLSKYVEFIHFGLTSQDINNTAFPLALQDAFLNILLPELEEVIDNLQKLSLQWKDIPMLAHTHGQPASPTFVGKEIYVFVERLGNQLEYLDEVEFCGKFGGATGNMNAHYVAYPDIDWAAFADDFLSQALGLERQSTTTQIEHYDDLAAFFDNLKRLNTILIDLCRDFWAYISMDYFKQKIIAGEVGSSTMPHKVNPIDFENAEGNLGIANALFEHLSAKLPISRLQRDLTDSTVIRNFGVPLGHSLIALKSLQKGLGKIILNEEKIRRDLRDNWAVVAEAIQTILRRESYPDPYNALKSLTRTHSGISQKAINLFIDELDIKQSVKDELKAISPENYTGKFNL